MIPTNPGGAGGGPGLTPSVLRLFRLLLASRLKPGTNWPPTVVSVWAPSRSWMKLSVTPLVVFDVLEEVEVTLVGSVRTLTWVLRPTEFRTSDRTPPVRLIRPSSTRSKSFKLTRLRTLLLIPLRSWTERSLWRMLRSGARRDPPDT